MKSIKTLVLAAFIIWVANFNFSLSAMQNADTSTLANVDPLSTLPPDLICTEIIAKIIEKDIRSCQSPIELEKGLLKACFRLSQISKINRAYKTFVNENIVLILRVAGLTELNLNMINQESGKTLIHMLADDDQEKIEFVRFLITAGANINAKILHTVHMNTKNIRYILINATPLHFAALRNHPNILAQLILSGADITIQIQNPKSFFNEWTALDFARRNNNQVIINMLETAYLQRGLAIPAPRVNPEPIIHPIGGILNFDNI